MTVANGQLADQNNFNSSFMSREEDTSTVGRVGLLSPNAGVSGPTIADVQKRLNELTLSAPVQDALANGAALTLNTFAMEERRRVRGASGPITLAAIPFGAGPFPDGKRVMLMGYHATWTVQLDQDLSANGAKINGGSIVLALHETAEFEYDLDNQLWILVRRNN